MSESILSSSYYACNSTISMKTKSGFYAKQTVWRPHQCYVDCGKLHIFNVEKRFEWYARTVTVKCKQNCEKCPSSKPQNTRSVISDILRLSRHDACSLFIWRVGGEKSMTCHNMKIYEKLKNSTIFHKSRSIVPKAQHKLLPNCKDKGRLILHTNHTTKCSTLFGIFHRYLLTFMSNFLHRIYHEKILCYRATSDLNCTHKLTNNFNNCVESK